jgi:hypothetical protein
VKTLESWKRSRIESKCSSTNSWSHMKSMTSNIRRVSITFHCRSPDTSWSKALRKVSKSWLICKLI